MTSAWTASLVTKQYWLLITGVPKRNTWLRRNKIVMPVLLQFTVGFVLPWHKGYVLKQSAIQHPAEPLNFEFLAVWWLLWISLRLFVWENHMIHINYTYAWIISWDWKILWRGDFQIFSTRSKHFGLSPYYRRCQKAWQQHKTNHQLHWQEYKPLERDIEIELFPSSLFIPTN